MQVQQIIGKNWYLVNSEEKFILANKDDPNSYEELSTRIEPNTRSTHGRPIYLFSAHSNEYVYLFQNQAFRIKGIQEIAAFDLPEYTGSIVQLLVGRNDKYTYFYIFKAPLNTDSISDTISITHLGSMENNLFPLPYEFSLKSKVHFYYENGYYYLDCSYLYFSYITDVRKPFFFFRFNAEHLETFSVHKGDRINFSENAKPETIVCPKGIFDVHSFKYFQIESLFEELPKLHTAYYYRVFSISENKKVLFVSETYVNFSNTLVGNKNYEFTNGLLYDLTNNRFVLPKLKCVFRRFLMYDYGMPHVFFSITKNGTFLNILSLGKKNNKFCRFCISKLCTTFSVFDKETSRKKSILFVETIKNNMSESAMMVFDENLHLELTETAAELQSILSIQPCSFFSSSNFENKPSSFVATEKNHFYPDTSYVTETAYSLGLIIKTPRGEFGENVYLPVSDTTHVDYNASFFKHEILTITSYPDVTSAKNGSYLSVLCRRNDFENHTYIINLNTGYSDIDNSFINSIAEVF